jgi:hypothetical protein
LCDHASQKVHQGLLFDQSSAGSDKAEASTRPYTVGFQLGRLPGQEPGRDQAQLLATVPAGSWSPLDLGRVASSAGGSGQLDAWKLFECERETIRQSVSRRPVPPSITPFFALTGESADFSKVN